ncbi:MAG: sel1 repeat family protein [Gammaproteobacteria bacterium TMED92]|nr:MAG: sel1 repeat family protein [Gammaproteobacteria bacterium TMED92]
MKNCFFFLICLCAVWSKNTVIADPFTAGITAVNRQHDATAFRAWKKVADRGDPEGQNNIAYLYERGMGVKQSYNNAKIWYELAAAQGLPEAKHNLAMLTYQGHLYNRDNRKSVEWFREAAEAGLRPSIYMLGVLYMKGEGVFKNYDKAFEHFMRAAKLGDPRGQYMVGHIYQAGLIDPDEKSDYEKAYLWSGLAMLGGMENAESIKIAASLHLSDEQEAALFEQAKRCLESEFADCN